MVLQRRMDTPIWGTANPGETVNIFLRSGDGQGTGVLVQADAQGHWRGVVKAREAGGPYSIKILARSGEIEIDDVLFGEVWICSGQSNMEFQVWKASTSQPALASADQPEIRLLRVPKRPATSPSDDVGATWSLCDIKTVTPFSAVGYFFGRELHEDLKVPIGLIESSWGGTAIASWTQRYIYEDDPFLRSILDRKHERFSQAATRAATSPAITQHGVGYLYNGMIHPLIPYGIRGVIWYQGEANATRAGEYRVLFPAMIGDWRKNWGEGDFPFLYVQLAAYGDKRARSDVPRDSYWAELREAQSATLKTANTGMAVAIDVGNEQNIHPTDKQTVGHRLALVARAQVYGEKVEFSGPMYESMQVEGNRIRLHFTHARGLKTRDGGRPLGFAVAGDDKRFVWAEARIDGEMIVVSSPEVAKPAAVRYAWDYFPRVNLCNGADLPMAPFRTDDWATPAPEER